MTARGVVDRPQDGCKADDCFYYRQSGDDVQVAVRKDFDRWANSIDFVFAIPKTRKAFDRLMIQLAEAANRKGSPTEIGKAIRITPRGVLDEVDRHDENPRRPGTRRRGGRPAR
jgi:hypothetical protein